MSRIQRASSHARTASVTFVPSTPGLPTVKVPGPRPSTDLADVVAQCPRCDENITRYDRDDGNTLTCKDCSRTYCSDCSWATGHVEDDDQWGGVWTCPTCCAE
jgi:hypothetical protein